MYTLENSKLKIRIKKIGAELCQISSINNRNEFNKSYKILKNLYNFVIMWVGLLAC